MTQVNVLLQCHPLMVREPVVFFIMVLGGTILAWNSLVFLPRFFSSIVYKFLLFTFLAALNFLFFFLWFSFELYVVFYIQSKWHWLHMVKHSKKLLRNFRCPSIQFAVVILFFKFNIFFYIIDWRHNIFSCSLCEVGQP